MDKISNNTFCLLSNHAAPGQTGGGTRVFCVDVSSPQCFISWPLSKELLQFVYDKPEQKCPEDILNVCVCVRGCELAPPCRLDDSRFPLPTRWQSCLAHKRLRASHLSRCSVQFHICTTNSQKAVKMMSRHMSAHWVQMKVRSAQQQVLKSTAGSRGPAGRWLLDRRGRFEALMKKKNGGKAGSSRVFSLDSPFKCIHGCVHAHYVNNSSLK